MRPKVDFFKINGGKMLTPDLASVSYADLDSNDSGRDESGFMHRVVIREKVPTWSFEYKSLSESEKAYMEGLFGNAATFQFTCPDRNSSTKLVTVTAYRSNFGVTWYNAKNGRWKNYKFNIVVC